MKSTKIEWVKNPDGTQGITWNPITGCTPYSIGCERCYAERMARRLQAAGNKRYQNGFAVTVHPDLFSRPLSWKKPSRIFVNSMSDLFHERVPDMVIFEIFNTIHQAKHHTFLILTKRSGRMVYLLNDLLLPPNLWMGVTVESEACLNRIDHLRNVPTSVRFVSFEPLLGRIENFSLRGIDWVIVGAESGPGARPMELSWVREIRDRCIETDTPFFFKQMIVDGKRRIRMPKLDGRIWDERPIITAVKEVK